MAYLSIPKQKPPKSGGLVSIADSYFGGGVVPVVLLPVSVVVLFLCFLLWCFLVLVVVVLWSPDVVCPEDAVLPLDPLWPAELSCATLNEAVRASANAIVNSFFTLFLSSWGLSRDKTE